MASLFWGLLAGAGEGSHFTQGLSGSSPCWLACRDPEASGPVLEVGVVCCME